MDRGDGDRDDRLDNRRDGNGRRAQDQLAEHQRNPYAHGELVGRLQQEGLNIRERFENRLNALERFKAQATMIGAVALMLLGATAGVVLTRLLR